MSSEAKRVKIVTLIEIVLGLALVIYGIVLVVSGSTTATPFVLCGEGVFTVLFGGRGALIANVPARIGKLATLAMVAIIVQIACVAGIVAIVGTQNVSNEPLPVVVGAVPAICSLVICFLSRGIAKKAER